MARRPTARGGPALIVVLIAGALSPASCGGPSDREKVERFIEDANAVHARATPALRRANAAYRQFGAGELSAREAVAATEESERLLRHIQAEVEKLQPPEQARRLKGLLLRVFVANAEVAEQTTLTARYLVDQARVLRRLRRLGRDLRAALGEGSGPEAQARGLGRYADGLNRVLERLRRLRAPLILEAQQDDQTEQLVDSRTIVRRLRSAILRRDPDRVVRLLDRLRSIDEGGQRTGLTRAAARRYNRLVDAITRAQRDVQRETARLDRGLE